jgi:LysM repeat protein
MVTYIVQPGDTLTLIAQRFGSTVASIVSVNNISDPNLIFVGQVLQIPVAGAPPAPPAPTPPARPRPGADTHLQLRCRQASDFTLCSLQILWQRLQAASGRQSRSW